jgi:uncharacterized membrane protein (UPF0127 family)
MQLITATDETRGTILGNRIEVADTSLTRMVGLLGRRGVDAGGGLWIRPSSGVHTFFMRFPIDVIGLDKNMRVIKLWKDLVPYRVTSVSLQLRSVIELPAGRIVECGVQLGDVLRISDAAQV